MESITRKTAIADSGFIYALINKKDQNNKKAIKAAKNHDRQWITTCFVFHEVFALLTRRPSHYHLIPNLFAMSTKGLLEIVNFEKKQLIEIEVLIKKYANKELDLTDASLIVLAEKLGHGDIFTVDINDFSACRWNKTNLFNILE